MKRASLILFVALMFPAHGIASPKAGFAWTDLAPGLSYARLNVPHDDANTRETVVHAFRIDPRLVRLDVITASPDETRGESIRAMAKREKALVAVNGGFFTPEHTSIGLVVKSGTKINPLHETSWWSIFAVKNGAAAIIPPWQAKNVSGYDMAIQAGPRLVVNGRMPKLKQDSLHARTAVGIQGNGKVVIAATGGGGLTMQELATLMKKNIFQGGLGCVDAMALDGGSSTQLYAKAGKLNLYVSGLALIPNGLAVFPR